MGDWTLLHYGGPIETGLTKSLCGMPMEGRHQATYRRYELEDEKESPANCKPCGTCRDALLVDRMCLRRGERRQAKDTIASVRRKLPGLIERGKWGRIQELAKKAQDASDCLKRLRDTPL